MKRRYVVRLLLGYDRGMYVPTAQVLDTRHAESFVAQFESASMARKVARLLNATEAKRG